MRFLAASLCAGLVLSPMSPARADIAVVVTSKPIHALVAGVMEGVGAPQLLVQGNQSPHTYTMKPSDAAAANRARVVFRVSQAVEPFTRRIFESLPATVQRVSLVESPGISLLAKRRSATFEAHGSGHAHTGHGHTGHGSANHARDTKPQPMANDATMDGHVWLDPDNARAIIATIARVLAAASPGDAERFHSNAAALTLRVDALDRELADLLATARGRPFVVFHDAFQYLEHHFGLTAAGSVVVSPETPPSARRLATIRRRIADLGPVCVFAEPGVSDRLLATVTEGTGARAGNLDPEGIRLEPGAELYFTLMRTLARDLATCLTAKD